MFLFNTEFSQGTVKLPAAADYEDFWNIEPSCGSGARPGCVHIHRDKCEDKRIVLSGQLYSSTALPAPLSTRVSCSPEIWQYGTSQL